MSTMTQPAPGMRVKKTTFTEVIPPEDRSPSDAKPSPFYDRDWEIVVQALTKEEWLGHKMRVYRAGEKWERGSAPVDNIFKGPFTEDDLRARFGGGKYVMWLYGPPKEQNLVGKYQVELDGAPILNGVPRNGNPSGNGSDMVAIEAMRMTSNPEFMRMQMEMMRQATIMVIETVKSQMPQAQDPLTTLRNAKEILGLGGPPAPNPMDEVMREFFKASMAKMMNPPESNAISDTMKILGEFKTAGLIPAAAPKADLASMFAANVPMLVDRVVTGLTEFRKQRETEVEIMRLQRGEIRPTDPNVITMDPPGNPAPASNAAAAPAAATGNAPAHVTPEVAQAIIAQAHLHRLATGIKNPTSTGQDMYDYLVNAWPEILDELVKFSKEDLLAFFKSREAQMQYFSCDTLTQVADDPRLPKIIEDFLAIAKKNASPPEGVAAQTVV